MKKLDVREQIVTNYKNTKNDFWASLDAGKNSIVCPCCGSHMSLQFSRSYRLMLTREASMHINQQLAFYRSMIMATERMLKRHNSTIYSNNVKRTPFPVDESLISPTGEFANNRGKETRHLLDLLDLEKIDKIILEKVPRIGEDDEKFQKLTAHDLLQLIQLPTLAAGLNTIALDQMSSDEVFLHCKPSDFLDAIKSPDVDGKNSRPNSGRSTVFSYLRSKFPYYTDYCGRVAASGSDPDGYILRALAILILYFGHEHEFNESQPRIDEFTLGTYAQLRSWQSLGELLSSYYYVSSLQGIYPDFTSYVQNLGGEEADLSDSFKLGGSDNWDKFCRLRDKIPQFEDVVLYTVDFACAGRAASIPEGATVIVRRDNQKMTPRIQEEIKSSIESYVCGWIPKEEKTESLLLVGGTASSKTTLLQSTIVQVKRAAANLGMVFDTRSPLSNLLMHHYEERYDRGDWYGSTEKGSRISIQISLRQADRPGNTFHLVVNDIAGERFEEMLMAERDYAVIQSPLSYARHIIFLFDLVAWRQLGALLQDSSDSGSWADVIAESSRQAGVGRAVADTRDLLIKLVDRLVASSGTRQLPVDRSFIFVIPKCDLYTQEGMFLHGWVNNLAKSGYLKRTGTGEDSFFMSTWKFKSGDCDNYFEAALSAINEMSQQASSAIKTLAKQLDGAEAGVSADRVALNVASMLTYLEKTFADVKVVPVSALGKNPKSDGDPSAGFSMKATPLFCEALLLLPMIKMGAIQSD